MLSDIHNSVRSAIGKGTSLDTEIVSAVRRAARFIEQQRTYQYMKKIGTSSFDLASDFPNIIDSPNHFKSISLVRLRVTADDGSYEYYRIPRSDNFAELEFAEGVPTGWELDGTNRIVFNADPEENWTVEFFYVGFTSWPTEDTATNWLIENGEEALVTQALLFLSVYLRDQRQRANVQASRDEAFRALIMADEDMSNEGYESVMRYTPEGGIDMTAISGT